MGINEIICNNEPQGHHNLNPYSYQICFQEARYQGWELSSHVFWKVSISNCDQYQPEVIRTVEFQWDMDYGSLGVPKTVCYLTAAAHGQKNGITVISWNLQDGLYFPYCCHCRFVESDISPLLHIIMLK